MGNLSLRNRDLIRSKYPELADMADDIVNALNSIADQTNASATGVTDPPPQVSALSVTSQGGIFDIQIQDNNPVSRGIAYFVEYSTTASFNAPIVIHLGPSRNYRTTLGNQVLFFRAYSQYPTSAPSASVYFGSQSSPTPVTGGGVVTGPVPQASAGSGTAQTTGTQGGAGYGHQATRGPQFSRGINVNK